MGWSRYYGYDAALSEIEIGSTLIARGQTGAAKTNREVNN